ncbi:MAG: 30S ribosome-binding factor RbfA [Planctomycetales bacterium]|nr:30S ribosome-binding factor RbfA [Planctomycetales bacterium]
MSSRRVLKAAEAIREVVSMAILTDLRDPRIQHVTVTFVEVSGDMRQAKVRVSVMGDESQQQLTLRGLQNAAGYLQQKVANRIDTRYTPKLKFELDKGVKHALEVHRILEEVLPKERSEAAGPLEAEGQLDAERGQAEETSPAAPDADDPGEGHQGASD